MGRPEAQSGGAGLIVSADRPIGLPEAGIVFSRSHARMWRSMTSPRTSPGAI
jgi:hypothetical protein